MPNANLWLANSAEGQHTNIESSRTRREGLLVEAHMADAIVVRQHLRDTITASTIIRRVDTADLN
ncbi:MAG: hypothetical protein ACREIF_02490 [Chthoniobacterales bacterium]